MYLWVSYKKKKYENPHQNIKDPPTLPRNRGRSALEHLEGNMDSAGEEA
jgi:hypothetical protein